MLPYVEISINNSRKPQSKHKFKWWDVYYKCSVTKECPTFIGVGQRGREFLWGKSENYISVMSRTVLVVKKKMVQKNKTT